jgi:hypothetical protein
MNKRRKKKKFFGKNSTRRKTSKKDLKSNRETKSILVSTITIRMRLQHLMIDLLMRIMI